MRLLPRVLPACRPADCVVPPLAALLPRAAALGARAQPVAPQPAAAAGEPLLAFLLGLVGRELLRAHADADEPHALAIGRASWRPAEAWQGIADAAVALLRRLLPLDAWRPALLELLEQSLVRGSGALRLGSAEHAASDVAVTRQAAAAAASFAVLGGHLWGCVPGARVTVLAAGEATATHTATLIRGGCDAASLAVVLEGQGGQAVALLTNVAAACVQARAQVSLAASLLLPRLPTLLEAYRPFVPASAATSAVAALVRCRALHSLQWLCEEAAAAQCVLAAGLLPSLVSTAVRALPLCRPVAREVLQRRLCSMELAQRDVAACRTPPHALAAASAAELQALLRARRGKQRGSEASGGEGGAGLRAEAAALLRGGPDGCRAQVLAPIPPYISPMSPLYLPYISPKSPPYRGEVRGRVARSGRGRAARAAPSCGGAAARRRAASWAGGRAGDGGAAAAGEAGRGW